MTIRHIDRRKYVLPNLTYVLISSKKFPDITKNLLISRQKNVSEILLEHYIFIRKLNIKLFLLSRSKYFFSSIILDKNRQTSGPVIRRKINFDTTEFILH